MKNNLNFTHIQQSAVKAVVSSMTILSLLFAAYFLAEPTISFGQAATEDFYIRQTITDESSFAVPPTNVTMAGDLAGITGGNASGSSQFVVQTNNASGYYVEISFENNGTPEAMNGDVDGSESIRDYDGDVGGEPSGAFAASTSAQFAYTVTSSSSADTDASFLNTGGTCGSGSQNDDTCWKSPAVSGFRIVDTTAPAPDGATSTVQFKVHVPNTPIPTLTAQTYTATATLSLFVK